MGYSPSGHNESGMTERLDTSKYLMTLKKHKAFGNEAGRYAVLPNRRQGTRKGQASHSGFPSRPWPPEAGPASASLSLGAWRVPSAAHHAFGHRSVGSWGFLGDSSAKESTCQYRRHGRLRFNPWVGKIPWRRNQQPSPVSLPGKSHGQRRLAGYSPWGRKESGTAGWLSGAPAPLPGERGGHVCGGTERRMEVVWESPRLCWGWS